MIGERGIRFGPRFGTDMGMGGDSSDVPQTTLTVAISDSTDPVITAVNYTYSVVVTNTGANSATNVTAVIVLDSSLSYVSSSGTGWSTGAVGQTVTCTRATLAVGAAPTITVTVTSGGSALTASTTADADADNSPAATQDVETTVVKLVTKDAGDGKRYPASATEWSDFNAYHVAIGTSNFPNVAPSALYLCQEASGNLADSIGTFTLAATGTGLTYQQTIGSSTRKAVATASGTTGLFSNADAGLPNLNATSMMALMVGRVTTTAARRDIIGMGAAATTNMIDTEATTGLVRAVCVGNVASGAADAGGANRIMWTQCNKTGSASTGGTDADHLAPALAGTVAGQQIAIGNYKFGGATCLYSYIVLFFSTAAEMSQNGKRALFTALGWSIAW